MIRTIIKAGIELKAAKIRSQVNRIQFPKCMLYFPFFLKKTQIFLGGAASLLSPAKSRRSAEGVSANMELGAEALAPISGRMARRERDHYFRYCSRCTAYVKGTAFFIKKNNSKRTINISYQEQ